MKIIKHTIFEISDLRRLNKFISFKNLYIRTEVEYDFEETGEVLLIGSEEDIRFLENNFYNFTLCI